MDWVSSISASVPVAYKLCAQAQLASVEGIADGVQVTIDAVIERDGTEKPVSVAQLIFRFYA